MWGKSTRFCFVFYIFIVRIFRKLHLQLSLGEVLNPSKTWLVLNVPYFKLPPKKLLRIDKNREWFTIHSSILFTCFYFTCYRVKGFYNFLHYPTGLVAFV